VPITVTATAGVLSAKAEAQILPRLSAALLERHGLTGNAFMTPLVVGAVNIVPAGRLYVGGKAENGIFVELKVPAATFTTQEQKQGFLNDVNAILDDLTDGSYPKDRTFLNITYAVDGSWGVGETAYTNAALGERIAKAS
jgi:hypothetical protein